MTISESKVVALPPSPVTDMTIAGGSLRPNALLGEVVIVTGAGGGIGLEAVRSLLWLGATVAIAEIDAELGTAALKSLTAEWPAQSVVFVATDVSDEASVSAMVQGITERFGKVDAVLNNATWALAGNSVVDTPIGAWDRSYAVNLRGPALLARACLPGMLSRHHGVFACVSSTGGPFLASYETLKAAQVALANALDAELEGTGVFAFTIGPGLVPTKTASAAVAELAPKLGMSVPEFWEMNKGAVLSVEAAGAGFAAAIAQAFRYGGQEISSGQALMDAGIAPSSPEADMTAIGQPATPARGAVEACRVVVKTFNQQAAGWKDRSFFERQWMLRDFKQRVGIPVERCAETLLSVERSLEAGQAVASLELSSLAKLAAFYQHLGELARGYVKDTVQRAEQDQITAAWSEEVQRLIELIQPATAGRTDRSLKAS